LLVIIENQDNPPLNVTAVRATRRPCWLSFHAAQPGNWQVYTANPFAAAPRYDLAGLGGRLKTEGVRDFQPGALAANPAYRPREVLPDIEKLGSPLDVANWRYRKLVTIARAGVQQLELDLETLARADQQCRDLRLLRDGQQRPYVLERTSRQQKIAVEASQANDPKRPTVSRWQMKLPHSRLPLTKLVCASPTGLFQRDLQLYERPTDERGEPFQRDLGHASWTRTPGSAVRTFEIALSATPLTDTVFLETDNRDNPPIELEKFAVYVPITRIWFKAPAEPATLLYFGNTAISAPQYDIALVAPQLLAAERHRPALGPVEQLKPTGWAERPETARSRNLIFWAALAVVVVVLLALVIKFLPKEPPPQAK
jgi:hypothetical protein